MRKALYLIPLILLALCASTITLHKDTVSNNPGGDLTSLRPGHWKMKNFESNTSASLTQVNSLSSSDLSKAAEPYSQDASFHGFPFGFYFSKSSKTAVSGLDVSAYSWLWAVVDGLIIILALLAAIYFNRPPRQNEVGQTPAAQQPIYPTPTSPSPTAGTPPMENT